jgi:PPM family protein phosphatase
VSSVGAPAWAIDRLRAAGASDAGLQREVNEDRCHADPARGIFIVVDGIGGQAAGGKAADIALTMVRARLERQTGPTAERVREAITVANNEIHRAASTRAEWNGMACVLTVAVIERGKATIGHVGDTRLYKLRDSRIEKITSDHSPVGEWEDAGEISEFHAMRHPRRNEVYRDVGSERHHAADPEFVDVMEIPFEPDAALLLCSDGLTDLVDSASIARTVRECAGNPDAVVRALIDAANLAGGKDNVTAVYVEGSRFAYGPSVRQKPLRVAEREAVPPVADERPRSTRALVIRVATITLLLLVIAVVLYRKPMWLRELPSFRLSSLISTAGVHVVRPTESLAAAVEHAAAGSRIIVEPGDYRERIVLKDGVSVISRVPRAATIRLPSAAADDQAGPAVLAANVSSADFVGFRIMGDPATPLGTGILVTNSVVSIADVDISGATVAGVVFSGSLGRPSLIGSELHDNAGAAIVVEADAAPRITTTVFYRNGTSGRGNGGIEIHARATPTLQRNTFAGVSMHAFDTLSDDMRRALSLDNWFVTSVTASAPAAGDGRQGRR